jgi:hypothetical protein
MGIPVLGELVADRPTEDRLAADRAGGDADPE